MPSFQEHIQGDKPVLVDFFATWCGPCQTLMPVLDKLKDEMGEQLTILKVDVDKNPQAAQHFGVRGVPLLILFKEGKVVWKQSGARPLHELRTVIAPHVASAE